MVVDSTCSKNPDFLETWHYPLFTKSIEALKVVKTTFVSVTLIKQHLFCHPKKENSFIDIIADHLDLKVVILFVKSRDLEFFI